MKNIGLIILFLFSLNVNSFCNKLLNSGSTNSSFNLKSKTINNTTYNKYLNSIESPSAALFFTLREYRELVLSETNRLPKKDLLFLHFFNQAIRKIPDGVNLALSYSGRSKKGQDIFKDLYFRDNGKKIYIRAIVRELVNNFSKYIMNLSSFERKQVEDDVTIEIGKQLGLDVTPKIKPAVSPKIRQILID